MKKLPLNKDSITIGILGVLIALLLVLIWWLYTDIAQNSQKLVSMKNQAIGLEIGNNQVDKFKTTYSEYRPNLEKMEQLFIDPKNPVDVIKFLEDTADTQSLTPKISLQPESLQKDKTTLLFQILVNGQFLDILHFSEVLEHGPYLLSIESANINSMLPTMGKNDSGGKVNATFLIKTFVKPIATPHQ